jgi:hypothetical protein
MTTAAEGVREKALSDYRKKLLEHKELEARLKESKYLPNIQNQIKITSYFTRKH